MTTCVTSLLDEQETARSRLAEATRLLQDQVRGSRLEAARADEIAVMIASLADELRTAGADDRLGGLALTPGRLNGSQTLSPVYEITSHEPGRVRGTVTFSRFHHGALGTVHGGSIALWADDILGRLALELNGRLTRTAYMHVDYDGPTPVGEAVEFTAWAERIEGRKYHLRATISVDGTAAVAIHGLWVAVP